MNTTTCKALIVLLVALVTFVGCDFGKKVDDGPEQTPVASGPSAAELRLTQLHAQYAAGRAITLGEVALTAQQGRYDDDGALVFEGVMFRLPNDEFVTFPSVRFFATPDDGIGASLNPSPDTPWNNVVEAFDLLEPEVDAIAFEPAE
jgi:hypothetical protein